MIKRFQHQLTIVFIVSFLAYANTLSYEFVLDDKIVITENSFTKKGVDGLADIFNNDSMTGFFGTDKSLVTGGRYRPLSMAIHAIEWEVFGNNPFWFHLFSVLFYALSVCLLFLILIQLLPRGPDAYLNWPFLATLFFALHPLHTEVVANIKSRDEIVSILFVFLSFLAMIKYTDLKKPIYLAGAGICFFLSLLSKESSVVFVAIIPMGLYYFKEEFLKKQLVAVSSSLVAITASYIILRIAIVGSAKIQIAKELMNNPFLEATDMEKWATIFYTLLLYLKLSFIPHPLTHDYYPKQIPIVDWTNVYSLLALAIYGAMLVYALYGLKKKNPISFMIWVYFAGLALYTNILFPIGTFMNERFLYVSTIGIALFFSYLMISVIKKRSIQLVLTGAILLLYGFKTIDRNSAWETDTTLSLTDIEISGNSAKCNMAAGMALLERSETQKNSALEKKDLSQSVKYLTKSLELYPTYLPPTLLMGNALTKLKDYEQGIAYYIRCLALSPGYSFALQNLEFVGQEASAEGQFETALKAYQVILDNSDAKAGIYERMGEIYGKELNRPDLALPFLEKALAKSPKDGNISQKLGIVYGMLGKNQEAINTFEQGISLNPDNGRLWLNLGISYQSLGNVAKANECFTKAFELEPALRNE